MDHSIRGRSVQKTDQFSRSVVSNSSRPVESQHARPPCPSPTPRVHPPMSIESVMPSSNLILCCPLLLPPSICPSIRVFSNESVLRIRCQSIGASASASVLSMNIQDWFPLALTGLILLSKGLSRVFFNTIQKHQFFGAQLIFLLGIFQISYIYPPTAQNTKGFFFSLHRKNLWGS